MVSAGDLGTCAADAVVVTCEWRLQQEVTSNSPPAAMWSRETPSACAVHRVGVHRAKVPPKLLHRGEPGGADGSRGQAPTNHPDMPAVEACQGQRWPRPRRALGGH